MKVSDLYPGIIRLLMGRAVGTDVMAENTRKGVLELTDNFKFAELQTTGPTVQFTQNIPFYDPNHFLTLADQGLDIKKVNSFYMYLNSSSPPTVSNQNQTNAGYNLKFRTIDTVEVLINVAGTPIYWTRHENQIWVGDCPDQAYYVYMRYQREHPFPNAGSPTAGNDTLYFPTNWQDILEYQGAMRVAQELNLSSKASELQVRLYGDAKFQQSGGLEGSPGLIFQRTSQENRDQTTARKSFRLRMSSV